MITKPIVTLFVLMSVDGKISLGSSDELDFDKDLPNIKSTRDGLYQYDEIEQTTDLWSLNSGKTLAKIGINDNDYVEKTPVTHVVIDNKNLTEVGVKYLCNKSKQFILVTTNKKHPAYNVGSDNMQIIYQDKLNLNELLFMLKSDYNCRLITLQTGSTLNSYFLRENLIDYVDIVVAPILVGGTLTPSIIGGAFNTLQSYISNVGQLELLSIERLKQSYIRLRYKVTNSKTNITKEK